MHNHTGSEYMTSISQDRRMEMRGEHLKFVSQDRDVEIVNEHMTSIS